MKRLDNNILYVDIEDLEYLGIIPPTSDITAKIYYRARYGAVPFQNPKSIEFFQNCKEIDDYDDLISLSSEEITSMLIKIEEEIFFCEHQFFNLVQTNFLARDEERKRKLKKLYHQKETLNKILNKKRNDGKKLL